MIAQTAHFSGVSRETDYLDLEKQGMEPAVLGTDDKVFSKTRRSARSKVKR